MAAEKPIESLVLDATPLITQSASALQQYATRCFTTPGVKAELRDDNARNQLFLWGDALVVRQPKQTFIDRVSSFAKLTGDYSVLSMNDIHITALAYELEFEKNGDAQLRQFPGQKLDPSEESDGQETKVQESLSVEPPTKQSEEDQKKQASNESVQEDNQNSKGDLEDDGFQVVTRKHKKQNWKYRGRAEMSNHDTSQNPEAEIVSPEAQDEEDGQDPCDIEKKSHSIPNENIDGEHVSETLNAEQLQEAANNEGESESADEDDDGDWITPCNLQEVMMKNNSETVRDAQADKNEQVSVAISTGDFACQNVSMQIGLKLMNYTSGKQIKSVKNFMYRCHACFKMVPMPKSGERKHFCPECGGNTLLRCAVSIDNVTGKVTPHLKSNFKWITKGQVYSLASPLSKSTQRKQGRAGHQHKKENRHKDLQDPLILREDQREYTDAVVEEARRRRKNEKMLQEYVGGGSADNIISPFTTTHRNNGVKVGRGRNANATKAKRK